MSDKPHLVIKRTYFSKVKEAREQLAARAEEAMKLYFMNIKLAMKSGNHDAASKALQWALEHMPAEEGVTVIDASIDKPKQIEAQSQPAIHIGFSIGGLAQTKTLPAAAPDIIDITPSKE